MRGWRAWTVAGLVACGLVARGRAEPPPDGAMLYAAECASCHGATAHGDGEDADIFSPAPRDLRDGILARYADDELVERIRHGTPLALARDPAAFHARASDTEAIVGYLKTLPRIDWRRVEWGEEVYVEQCELCHGPYGHAPAVLPSGVRTPTDLADAAWQRRTGDAALLERLRNGHDGMPAVPGLRDEQTARAVVAFVRLLGPGFERYSRDCAACHGDDGRGTGVGSATERLPTVVFDAAYLQKKDPDALRRDVWHMLAEHEPAMPHLRRRVTPRDVRAILAWLRGLPTP
jgi:mono/diheme cytochrome c family protein